MTTVQKKRKIFSECMNKPLTMVIKSVKDTVIYNLLKPVDVIRLSTKMQRRKKVYSGRFIENDSGIKIDRRILENLVSGKEVADVTQIIVTAPPRKPLLGAPEGADVMPLTYWDEEDESAMMDVSPKKKLTGEKMKGSGRSAPKRSLQGLPEHLKGLLGQANLVRARGNDEEALKLSLEIIRQCPHVSEPYFTVGAIYEANGDEEKAMQFYTISTHLGSADVSIWEKLIDFNLRKSLSAMEKSELWFESLREVVRCCGKAIQDCTKGSSDDDSMLEYINKFALLRWECCEKMSARDKTALKKYLCIIKDHIDTIAYSEMAQRLVQWYFEDKEAIKALEVLENLRVYHPSAVSVGDLNILLELLIAAKLYGKCVVVACKMFSIKLIPFDASSPDGTQSAEQDQNLSVEELDKVELVGLRLKIADVELPKYKSIYIPLDTHLDIKVKLAVSLVHTGNFHLIEGVLHELFLQDSLVDILDMFADVCESMRENELWSEESAIWERLSLNENLENHDDIVYKLGECKSKLGQQEESAELYRKVLVLNPDHIQCRLNLATYYRQVLNNAQMAVECLAVPDECSDNVKTDVRIVNMRMDLQEESSDELFFQTVYDIFHYVFSTISVFTRRAQRDEEICPSSPSSRLSQKRMRNEKHPSNRAESMNEDSDAAEEATEASLEVDLTANSSLIANMAKERKKMCRMKWRRIQEQIKRRLNVSWSKFIKAIRIGLRLSQGSKVGRPSRKGDVLYMAVQAGQHNVYPEYTRDIQLFAVRLGIEVKQPNLIYYVAKNLIQATDWTSRQAWGIFNIVSSMLDDNRAHKYLMYMDKTQKKTDNFYKSLFLALNSLESGNYKVALAELSLHFVSQQHSPLYNFLIGILYLHFGSQRFSKQKGVLFSLSVFFLKRYHALRCYPQESYYNLARAFHQIDLLPQAIFYYNKCLQSQSIKAGPDVQQDPAKAVGSNQKLTIFSTERFAAYNLTRIYLNSGAKIPALKLLRKYPLQ
ncbi:general transcription factor 3C polypeptide 3-like isoform X2 [Convolutriloba macropyga]|uniref:general transcription factor 3C polypeptide 3-like isoform X2 n=1 Tax=Convolutriloba macropyga TaxID=536237 RepID=UPI003F51C213